MKALAPHRDPARVRALAEVLRARLTRPRAIMEVCGGQTHAFVRFGVDRLLPEGLTLLHGPGCPVCVTPAGVVDQAMALAARPEVILTTFGDMLRVPGSRGDLLGARARGGDVRVVASPLGAVELAAAHPGREVVFFAVGFETTAPASAAAALAARARGLHNLSLLCAHVLVPPAMAAIGAARPRRVEGFLAAGHVCAIEGLAPYRPLAAALGTPIVVTGFEPVDLLQGLIACVEALEAGRAEVINAYARVVPDEGNPAARAAVAQVFEPCDRDWRGIGRLPASGLRLREAFAGLDAERRFSLAPAEGHDDPDCLAGEVLQGLRHPRDCPAFGVRCTPDHPLGATMVSSEGACAAWYRYARHRA